MSEETDSVGEDTVAAVEPESEPVAEESIEVSTDEARPARSRRLPRRWIAAAVLALGLIGAGYEGWLLYDHHQRTVAAAQALDAAERYTLRLTGVDPASIDKNFAEVIDGATGEFKDMYSASAEQLRQLLIENKATAHGTVIDSAVKSATKNKVEVLLFVDQSVSNKASPQAKIDRSRIVMTMEKVNGRWLAAKVDMP
ncbi:Mce protein [Mycolicibacter sp. MYC123]|uniref:Mce protein n=1 Tax=[Mycobacterium] zoologicum TaxID=2872311 RepID=A0ABU5YQX9_9MYCO|nr:MULTISPECIES: Mce protein [unclassified Mycolicibacter]MEB3051128.1 Mce protein [Mycolicibacter sp. MYC123]MEB3064258.1 Mce protein [Mycolicibacter sp. MYC101]